MKYPIVLFLALFSCLPVYSQKFGYVDTNYILNRMPEYQEVKAEIDRLSLGWQDEILAKSKEIEGLYDALQAEQVLLTDEMKAERLTEIKEKEESLKEFQKEIFGFEGLFFLKKQELVKPLLDEIFEAIEQVAKENRLAIIFDKSRDLVMVYTDPRHDYTDFVLDELGLGNPNDTIK